MGVASQKAYVDTQVAIWGQNYGFPSGTYTSPSLGAVSIRGQFYSIA